MTDNDDIIRVIDDDGGPTAASTAAWKVAVIDDDPAVHEGTRFALTIIACMGKASRSCLPILPRKAAR